MVELRLNTNQKNLTIEEVIGKMKRSHLDLLDLMSDDLKYSGAPDPTLLPLVSLKQEARDIAAETFNRPAEYGNYTRRALDTQQKVLVDLSLAGNWTEAGDDGGDVWERMLKVVALQARAGAIDAGISTLKAALARVGGLVPELNEKVDQAEMQVGGGSV